MFKYAKKVRLASLRLSLALSGSYWISPCLSLALYESLWLSVTPTLALTGSHCHSLAYSGPSGSLLLSYFAYTALDRLTGPLISSHCRCHDDTLQPAPVLHRILQTGSCKPFYITFWFDKELLEKVFYSNTAPSLGFVNHLFYKIEYMGRSCPNQVWTITFD